MADGTGARFQVSRPTINVAGQDNSMLTEGLVQLTIVETVNGLYRCESLFGNWGPVNGTIDYLYFDRQTLDFGKPFQVKVGPDVMLDGRITGLEAHFLEGQPPRLSVLAEDRFQDLRMTRRTRTFADVSDSDVIQTIAGEHGLSPSVSVNGPTYKVLAQVNQSDLAFLRERTRAIGAELWMDSSTLNAKPRSSRGGTSVAMNYGASLRQFSVLADLANQRSSVSVNGWDVAGKSAVQETADDSAISGELNGDKSGASILSASLGERKEALAHTVPLNSQEAQAAAEAYFKMQARRFIVGRGIAKTDKQLRVGAYVDLQGLGPLFSGKYYLAEVRHIFDLTHGLRTEFVAERPGLGEAR
jgi:uncharacterized protein